MADKNTRSFSKADNWRSKKSVIECNEHMLNSGIGADVSFLVGPPDGSINGNVHAHRYVLMSRSEVFEAMFLSGMTESHNNCDVIKVPDIELETFEAMLRYMYCDRCDITMSNAVPLMQAANKYMVSGLVESCETFMVAHLNSGNVCILLELSIVICSERLEKDCLSYICKHTRNIVETNRFFKLSRLALKRVVQQDKLMLCNEDEVYDMCMHWAKRQLPESQRINPTCEELRNVLGDAFGHIRFLSMTHVQFANLVGTSNMLTPQEKNDIYLYIATKQHSACLQFDMNVRTFLECRVVRLEMSDDLRLRSDGKVCAIDFMTSFSTSLTGIGLYGGTEQTDLYIQVEVSCSGKKLYKTASKRLTSDGSKTVIRVPLRRKHFGVRIMAKKVYTVQVTISGSGTGQETFCGSNGVTMLLVGDFQQTIMFFDSSVCHDVTHTNVRQGQIPELYFSQEC